MLGCKSSGTPMDNAIRLHQDNGQAFPDVTLYRRLVGRLIYITTTRLDIAFATQQLSQFMAHPTQSHFQAAIRVLKYLKDCPGRGLLFHRDSLVQLVAFSDAD